MCGAEDNPTVRIKSVCTSRTWSEFIEGNSMLSAVTAFVCFRCSPQEEDSLVCSEVKGRVAVNSNRYGAGRLFTCGGEARLRTNLGNIELITCRDTSLMIETK